MRVKDIELEPIPEPQRLTQWKIKFREAVPESRVHGFEDDAKSIQDLEDNPYPELEARVSVAIFESHRDRCLVS